MAHFAKLDENNIVTQVVVVNNKDTADAFGVEKEHIGAAHLEKILGGTWKQTSYNGNIRKNYAGIGYSYMPPPIDGFVPPQPFESWNLDPDTCQWAPPVAMPEGMHAWDDDAQTWVAVAQNA